MQLVDDDHAKRAEQARRIAMRQHQCDLLRRGEQDVGGLETLALAAGGRCIAGAGLERDRQPHLGNRFSQVAGDIDGKRLQRRHIEGVNAGMLLGTAPSEIRQGSAGSRPASCRRRSGRSAACRAPSPRGREAEADGHAGASRVRRTSRRTAPAALPRGQSQASFSAQPWERLLDLAFFLHQFWA